MSVFMRETAFGRLFYSLTNAHIDFDFEYNLNELENVSEPENSTTSKRNDLMQYKLVDWDGPDDLGMPRNWSKATKGVIITEVLLLNFSFYAAAAIFTPSIPPLKEHFDTTAAEGTLGLSLFVIAYGIGPLFLSPISNLPSVGRTPVYLFGSLACCLFNVGTALAKNMQTVLILRFLSGLVGCAPISIGGATLSEVLHPIEIPYAFALYAVSGVCGPSLGPIFGTLVVERWDSWTASLWLLSGLACIGSISIFFLLPETLDANILLRRAQHIRRRTGDPRYRTQSEIELPGICFAKGAIGQIVDDFKLSCMDAVIIFVNIHTMLIYGILYLWFEFFPFVFNGIYGFDETELALAFFGILVGALISAVAYLLWLYYFYLPTINRGKSKPPEARLIPGEIGAVCIPICLFTFAWTSRGDIHWIVPIIGSAFFAPGFYLTFQSVLNYLGESYPRYVASVFAGNNFFRSAFGGALPLAAPQMLQTLGIGWSSSVLGFISLAMVPLPFILHQYGERLRAWSRYAN